MNNEKDLNCRVSFIEGQLIQITKRLEAIEEALRDERRTSDILHMVLKERQGK